ncbi:hypothetical protein FOWG_16872 [Fusarium oxysporum f. sp. lycopersici MN25]|nr:hypothetical protein FOWG_16872 [Fusarium oxysporum f. sp. lycopersici MN25]
MWHDGYFEPSQNPHMAQRSLEISPTSTGTNYQPFWVVSTKDINGLVFTQAARFIVPLDHLFREACISNTISPPSLILAFYTAQLFCRLLTYALTSKEQFPYDNWIWLSRWTSRSRTHHTRELRERLGLGLNWYAGHIALEKLIQLYIPRNPIQRGLLSQMNVQRLAASSISIELSLRQLLNQAKNEFDRGCQRNGNEVIEKVMRPMTEEIARAYHQHMIAKLQLYWERVRTQVGCHRLPRLQQLQQIEQESGQVGRIATAQTIWEIYDEAWSAYIRIHPVSDGGDLPPNVPCWMATRNKDVATDRRPGTCYQKVAFFRIQYWAPYFSPPQCVDFSSWVSVANYQLQNPYTPSPQICSALNAIEYQDRSNVFTQLWAQLVVRNSLVQGTKAKEKIRICEQAMDCLMDLVGPKWSHRGKITLVLPWRFPDSINNAERYQDYLRLPILSTSSRPPGIPNRPTIILPSRHNVMALVEAIGSLPRINQEILQRTKWIREMLHNEGKQYAMRSHLEAKQEEMDAVLRPHSLLRQFLAQTTPPQRVVHDFGMTTKAL